MKLKYFMSLSIHTSMRIHIVFAPLLCQSMCQKKDNFLELKPFMFVGIRKKLRLLPSKMLAQIYVYSVCDLLTNLIYIE